NVDDNVSPSKLASAVLFSPEPSAIFEGRPFLYDASISSDNGIASCSACHVYGDFDKLAWDLGNPLGEVIRNFVETNKFHQPRYESQIVPGEAPAGELTLTIQGEEYNINYQGDLGSAIAALLASTRPGMEDVSVAQEFSNMALSMYVGSEDPEDPKKNSLFLR